MRQALVIDPLVRLELVAQAIEARPVECCGLLVGRGRHIVAAVPMRNVAESRVRFRLDDRAHLDLRRTLRVLRPALDIVGVYHSHPAGRAWPSETDIEQSYYPDWAFVIVGLAGRPRVAAFRIRNGRARPWAIRWQSLTRRP